MSHAPDTITPDRRANFVALAVIAILLAALYFGIQTGLNDAAFQFLGTAALVILALFAGWLWLAFGAGLSDVARKRVLIAGGIVIASVAIFRAAALRRVGYTGNMRPIYAWRWEAAPNAAVVDAPKESLTDAPAVEPEWLQAPYRYPQFLGPNRHPVIENVTVGRNWIKVKPNQLWKQPIGEGWSSFAVYGELAVTQEQRGNQEFVVCYHLLTGQELWKHADEGRFSEFMGGDGPRATPTIFEDGEPFVCTLGATGTLNCLSLADGKPRWPARNILSDAEALNLQWAMAGSPLVYDDLIVVNPGGKNGNSLVAYDRATGERKWSGGDSQAAYCSPTLMTLCGQRQVVIVNQLNVTGHNAENGQVLWTYEWPGNQPKVAQPVAVGNDRVFCSTGYGTGCMLLEFKTDADGKFTIEDLYGGRNRNMKTKLSNVAIHNGHVYGLDDGIMECLELESGERKWKKGRFGHGQLILVGDDILVLAENGELLLLEANPEKYVEHAKIQAITGKTWNTPALAGPYLLVRNDQEAACYKLLLLDEPPVVPVDSSSSE
jgi:outer membrane protein assembly factor BamB